MRILVIGASGAIGRRLVPQLVERGHDVIGTHRTPDNAGRVLSLGARPAVLDLLDPPAVERLVGDAGPDVVVHEATALADPKLSRHLDRTLAPTSRLRTEGTDALLAAARAAGVRRFVAQSFANFRYARVGGWVKTEEDPLDDDMPASASQAAAAMRHVDEVVTAAGGVALRYGAFYGNPDDAALEPVRRRLWPIVDGGDGMTSFVHLDDAAAATVLAIESDVVGVYNVVDDEPAAGRDWLPAMAEALGVKPPRHVPRWLARLVAGEAVAVLGTEARGASNAKAKRELGWTLRYPTWRTGFAAVLGSGLAAA